jgi:type IV secretory pathway VirB10-like protein
MIATINTELLRFFDKIDYMHVFNKCLLYALFAVTTWNLISLFVLRTVSRPLPTPKAAAEVEPTFKATTVVETKAPKSGAKEEKTASTAAEAPKPEETGNQNSPARKARREQKAKAHVEQDKPPRTSSQQEDDDYSSDFEQDDDFNDEQASAKVERKPPKIVDPDDDVKCVLVVGKTGNGKSSVGNMLLGEDKFKVGRGMSSTTLTAQAEESAKREYSFKVS